MKIYKWHSCDTLYYGHGISTWKRRTRETLRRRERVRKPASVMIVPFRPMKQDQMLYCYNIILNVIKESALEIQSYFVRIWTKYSYQYSIRLLLLWLLLVLDWHLLGHDWLYKTDNDTICNVIIFLFTVHILILFIFSVLWSSFPRGCRNQSCFRVVFSFSADALLLLWRPHPLLLCVVRADCVRLDAPLCCCWG